MKEKLWVITRSCSAPELGSPVIPTSRKNVPNRMPSEGPNRLVVRFRNSNLRLRARGQPIQQCPVKAPRRKHGLMMGMPGKGRRLAVLRLECLHRFHLPEIKEFDFLILATGEEPVLIVVPLDVEDGGEVRSVNARDFLGRGGVPEVQRAVHVTGDCKALGGMPSTGHYFGVVGILRLCAVGPKINDLCGVVVRSGCEFGVQRAKAGGADRGLMRFELALVAHVGGVVAHGAVGVRGDHVGAVVGPFKSVDRVTVCIKVNVVVESGAHPHAELPGGVTGH